MYNQLNTIQLDNYPILFNENSHEETSDRYQHIDTIEPIKVIQDFGWQPRQVISVKTRKQERQGFQKHRVRFFNPNLPVINDSFVELLLTNSHDGKSSFQLALGVFRLVCSNGLVVGDTFQSASVRHVGYTNEKIATAVSSILPETERAANNIGSFSGVTLSQPEQEAYARSVIEMRLDGEEWLLDDSYTKRSVLSSRRTADRKDDLWTVMNRVQESVLRTGFNAKKKDEYGYKKVRAVKSLDESDKLNKAIWTLAEEMAAIKSATV